VHDFEIELGRQRKKAIKVISRFTFPSLTPGRKPKILWERI
jgi:hypothetical protein